MRLALYGVLATLQQRGVTDVVSSVTGAVGDAVSSVKGAVSDAAGRGYDVFATSESAPTPITAQWMLKHDQRDMEAALAKMDNAYTNAEKVVQKAHMHAAENPDYAKLIDVNPDGSLVEVEPVGAADDATDVAEVRHEMDEAAAEAVAAGDTLKKDKDKRELHAQSDEDERVNRAQQKSFHELNELRADVDHKDEQLLQQLADADPENFAVKAGVSVDKHAPREIPQRHVWEEAMKENQLLHPHAHGVDAMDQARYLHHAKLEGRKHQAPHGRAHHVHAAPHHPASLVEAAAPSQQAEEMAAIDKAFQPFDALDKKEYQAEKKLEKNLAGISNPELGLPDTKVSVSPNGMLQMRRDEEARPHT